MNEVTLVESLGLTDWLVVSASHHELSSTNVRYSRILSLWSVSNFASKMIYFWVPFKPNCP